MPWPRKGIRSVSRVNTKTRVVRWGEGLGQWAAVGRTVRVCLDKYSWG